VIWGFFPSFLPTKTLNGFPESHDAIETMVGIKGHGNPDGLPNGWG